MAVEAPFGKRLKQAREQAGISQKRLGVLAGIEESNASAIMNQYERNTHMPKFATVRNIARALNVPAAYFYTDEDDLAELLLLFGTLNKKHQQTALADIRKLNQQNRTHNGNYKQHSPTSPPTIHEK